MTERRARMSASENSSSKRAHRNIDPRMKATVPETMRRDKLYAGERQ